METLLLPEDLTRSMKELGQSEHNRLHGHADRLHGPALSLRGAGRDHQSVSPVANRKPETEGLIRALRQPHHIAFESGRRPDLKELLGRVRDVTLDALNHAELPFEVLLDHLDVHSVQWPESAVQCYFFYQLAFLRPRELDRLTVTPLPDFGLGTHYGTADGPVGPP